MKIIIIGNGFDLNLGLKTSYKDFMENDYFSRSHFPSGNADWCYNFSEHLGYRDYHYIDRASQASLQCSQGEDYK